MSNGWLAINGRKGDLEDTKLVLRHLMGITVPAVYYDHQPSVLACAAQNTY